MRHAVLLAATATAASAEIVMHRDPGCGCCMKWAAQVKAAFGDRVRVVDDAALPAFQRRVLFDLAGGPLSASPSLA